MIQKALHLSLILVIPFFICLINPITGQSGPQSIELPTLLELEISLTTYHNIELAAQLKALEQIKSSDWKDLLPSLGVAYTPSGSPRPSANWSPLQILDRKEKDKKRKLDKSSLLLSYELLLTDRLFKLRQLYHDYQIDLQSLQTKTEMIEIDENLFAITERKYEENIIKPSEYLAAKKSVLLVRANLEEYRQELMKKRNEILYEAKWN